MLVPHLKQAPVLTASVPGVSGYALYSSGLLCPNFRTYSFTCRVYAARPRSVFGWCCRLFLWKSMRRMRGSRHLLAMGGAGDGDSGVSLAAVVPGINAKSRFRGGPPAAKTSGVCGGLATGAAVANSRGCAIGGADMVVRSNALRIAAVGDCGVTRVFVVSRLRIRCSFSMAFLSVVGPIDLMAAVKSGHDAWSSLTSSLIGAGNSACTTEMRSPPGSPTFPANRSTRSAQATCVYTCTPPLSTFCSSSDSSNRSAKSSVFFSEAVFWNFLTAGQRSSKAAVNRSQSVLMSAVKESYQASASCADRQCLRNRLHIWLADRFG